MDGALTRVVCVTDERLYAEIALCDVYSTTRCTIKRRFALVQTLSAVKRKREACGASLAFHGRAERLALQTVGDYSAKILADILLRINAGA